jgi:hypothetical protein
MPTATASGDVCSLTAVNATAHPCTARRCCASSAGHPLFAAVVCAACPLHLVTTILAHSLPCYGFVTQAKHHYER